MQKKLVYIIQSLGIGGVEVALLSAIPALNSHFDFRLVCLHKINKDLIGHLTLEEQSKIITFETIGINYLHAIDFILKYKPDIIISSLWKTVFPCAVAKLLNKQIYYFQFVHSSVFFHQLDRMFLRWGLNIADAVLCDSESAKSFIKKELKKSKPIEIVSFLRLNTPLDIPSKENVQTKALFVGRIHPVKRIDRLLLLIERLKQNGLNFTVDIYGRDDGSLYEINKLIKEKKLQNNVYVKGEIAIDKVENLFGYYDYYFQTSEAEGMAMSVVEAMQHGLVCVLTPVGEIKNYAQQDENAILIEDSFEQHLDQTIKRIAKTLEDKEYYHKLSEKAHKTFKNHECFDKSLVDKIKKTYNSHKYQS